MTISDQLREHALNSQDAWYGAMSRDAFNAMRDAGGWRLVEVEGMPASMGMEENDRRMFLLFVAEALES